MTFTFKLAQRLARLKHRTAIAALIAVATIFSCELPVRSTDSGSTITQLVVAPKNVTLQPNPAPEQRSAGQHFARRAEALAVRRFLYVAVHPGCREFVHGFRERHVSLTRRGGAFPHETNSVAASACVRVMSQSATSGVDLRHGGEIRAGLHCRNARCSEQSRRKAVTQSHGATAGQSATLAGPPAIHHGST